ncbi:FtsW/RodA/SpoVE family cell cycle protein [Gleimia hominis]|uniref:FtsW/RodA/SpoVE family cell cycle protein n=1 Tax=Gleimia hominis TaxID=595468 RepID=A0ABU3IA67_9ACTO|nr:FtsW/RodA/SpoVE family cell cycle protein [Gleimia hominis]MDT3766806.1 FtsW/RodA/SpoVE family cell cycle protein [Gleimia hominis]WIK64207.1 FtsW/RodA/SpoVE family cell cycle protein [Gleimia hominis]
MATATITPARRRPFVELLLLIGAIAAGLGGYVLTYINRTDTLPTNVGLHAGLLVIIAIVADLGVRKFAPYSDPVILPMAVALSGVGMAMIFRLDMSYKLLDQPQTGIKQLLMTAAGLLAAALVLIFVKDHRLLRRYTFTAMIISLVLLLSPLVPGLGVEHFGSRIWLNLGFASIQPAEFVKITLAVFFAGYLVDNRDKLSIGGPKILGLRLPRGRDLGPIIVVWLTSLAILVFQRDLGTSLLFFGLFVAMLYVATNRVSWLVIGAISFIPAAWAAMHTFSHVRQRINIWLHAFDPQVYNAIGGSGQVVQGQFGMASGGLLGTGWGRGYPQLVPFAQSDFILSSLAEELGLTGLLAILLMYLVLIQRGLRAAIGVRDGFGKLLASGISFSLALQLFVVLGGITRIIPLTGLTAPFLAQGGSSMIASWILIALLLRISDASRRPTHTQEVK